MKKGSFILLVAIIAVLYTPISNFFYNYTVSYDKSVILGGESIGFYSTSRTNTDSNNLATSDGTFSAGTLTYIDPEDNTFGALGHEYNGELSGKVIATNVRSYVKSGDTLGYKVVQGSYQNTIGEFSSNTNVGVFGTYYKPDNVQYIDIGMPRDIHRGDAYIRTIIEDNRIEYFKIEITKVDYLSGKNNIHFKVVDERLLSKTGGLIQGMSGSPIIQNNRLIGAVRSVDNDSYDCGTGVFITTMLKKS